MSLCIDLELFIFTAKWCGVLFISSSLTIESEMVLYVGLSVSGDLALYVWVAPGGCINKAVVRVVAMMFFCIVCCRETG